MRQRERIEKIIELLNEFYVPMSGRGSLTGYVILEDDSDADCGIMECCDSHGGDIDEKEAMEHIREGLNNYGEWLNERAARTVAANIAFEAITEAYNAKDGLYGGHPTYALYLASEHWQGVRKAAIERAGGKCMLCNTDQEALHVHHRTYERVGNEQPADVIVLCATHHAQFHGKESKP